MYQNEFYPEIHRRLYPLIEEAVARFDGGDIDNFKLDNMVNHVVNRSGIMRNPPRGHSRSSINDFTRFLLLCQLFGQCPPVFIPPAFPIRPPVGHRPGPGPRPPIRPFQIPPHMNIGDAVFVNSTPDFHHSTDNTVG